MRPNIIEYYSVMAMVVSSRATCPRRQVGCVIVDANNNIISTGYNGVARKMPHCTDTPCGGENDNSDNGYNSCQAVHAEQNALLQCANVNKIDKIYITTAPCITCAKLIANTSCKEVIYTETHRNRDGANFLKKVGIKCLNQPLKKPW
jgi:dCMP deaminase